MATVLGLDMQFLTAVAKEIDLVHQVLSLGERAHFRQHDGESPLAELSAIKSLRSEYTRLVDCKRLECQEIDHLREQTVKHAEDRFMLERQILREKDQILNQEKTLRKRDSIIKDMKEVIDEMKAKLTEMKAAIETKDETIQRLTDSIAAKDTAFIKKMAEVKRDVGILVVPTCINLRTNISRKFRLSSEN